MGIDLEERNALRTVAARHNWRRSSTGTMGVAKVASSMGLIQRPDVGSLQLQTEILRAALSAVPEDLSDECTTHVPVPHAFLNAKEAEAALVAHSPEVLNAVLAVLPCGTEPSAPATAEVAKAPKPRPTCQRRPNRRTAPRRYSLPPRLRGPECGTSAWRGLLARIWCDILGVDRSVGRDLIQEARCGESETLVSITGDEPLAGESEFDHLDNPYDYQNTDPETWRDPGAFNPIPYREDNDVVLGYGRGRSDSLFIPTRECTVTYEQWIDGQLEARAPRRMPGYRQLLDEAAASTEAAMYSSGEHTITFEEWQKL